MIELYQLEQLASIAKNGTLVKAAEELHLSQPALSRSMQKLEEELQVGIFSRQKNKIEFNETGKLAVEYAEKILKQTEDMVERLRAFDRSQRTILVGSCAPSPLWEIPALLSDLYPQMTISSEIKPEEILLSGLCDGTYQMIVLSSPMIESIHVANNIDITDSITMADEYKDSTDAGTHDTVSGGTHDTVSGDTQNKTHELYCQKYSEEHLYFSLPPAHPFADRKTLRMSELNGETMLLRSKLGFWRKLHDEKMPDTTFLVQNDNFAFYELVKSSALPSFTSNLSMKRDGKVPNRVFIPISDEEANVTFHCLCLKKNKALLEPFFRKIAEKAG